jgi:hypothetical protein
MWQIKARLVCRGNHLWLPLGTKHRGRNGQHTMRRTHVLAHDCGSELASECAAEISSNDVAGNARNWALTKRIDATDIRLIESHSQKRLGSAIEPVAQPSRDSAQNRLAESSLVRAISVCAITPAIVSE